MCGVSLPLPQLSSCKLHVNCFSEDMPSYAGVVKTPKLSVV